MVHMEIKIFELESNKARIVIVGEGHTFMNALVDEILKDSEVDVARYHLEFDFSDPELLVTTYGNREPLDAIKDACRRLAEECDTLIDEIEAAPTM